MRGESNASQGGALAVSDISESTMDALWLATLQVICRRAAHEIKGALNGVSVNLEVVRSRASKPDALAWAVGKYADAAADQLDAVIAMTESVLSLARETPSSPDLGVVVRRVLDLLSPVAKADGRQLQASGSLEDLGKTSAAGSAVRFAIGRCLLAAVDASHDARCSPDLASDGAVVRIESLDGATLSVDDDVVAAAASAGIRIQAVSSVISISFPR